MSAALLGSRISLVSKKNIRYEGILYSINESDATVALQNVRSFGTEGREKTEQQPSADGAAAAFVPPSDAVHPYLLFRGCDIKDLHVHEEAKTNDQEANKPPEDPAILSAEVPEEVKRQQAAEQEARKRKEQRQQQQQQQRKQETKSGDGGEKSKRGSRGGRKNDGGGGGGGSGGGGGGPRAAIGTGQNLMSRKERGVVDGAGPEPYKDTNFDIQGNLEQFDKSDDDLSDDEEDVGAYEMGDFFDTISSDVTDRAEGKSTGLRGAQERKLNTETFGATSLGGGGRRRGGRRRYGGRGGRGRGRGGGRGGSGRGSGGGRSYNRSGGSSQSYEARGGAPVPAPNNRWQSAN
mmetsp:Transcript_34005/g.74797  ORF Transcript_34005/g.74797 Transcript_34005/m.74797 type:complete len:349 (+) Transcript_34005:329-1375(+)